MAQKNRANMLTDIVSNIYNNLINFITGQNAQDRFVNLLDSSPNILSDASQANGYVSTDANNEMFSSYYDEEISRADLISDLTANLAVGGKFYRINDAVGTTITLLVIAESNINLYPFGIDATTGEIGTYDITTDVFIPIAGSGNANITPITAAALLALPSFSTTTIYVVTDAPFRIAIQAETTSQLGQTGTIVDDVYSGIINYDLASNTFLNGTIYDGDGNTWNGVLPSATTLGAGCVRNTFNQGCALTLGTNAIDNTFGSKISGFVFGNSLQYVTVEAGLSGADYSTLPAYSFLYSNAYPATIFRIGGINYHRYYDVANDRIVITDLATPANVTYIGGGGGGDAYLANDQTFTGENTFDIPSGNDTPVTITKGGNGAGLKVTKSSGSGDAIEVAEGSVSIDDETASTIASFDANKRIKSLATSTYPSLTELSYVKGVTSAIQTQLNALANTYSVNVLSQTLLAPADATSYHFGINIEIPASATIRREFKFPQAGTMTAFSFNLLQAINGSNQTCTIYLRNTTTSTDYTIGTFTSDFGLNGALKTVFSGLSIAVNTTDDWAVKILTPTWTTNPTNWIPNGLILIET